VLLKNLRILGGFLVVNKSSKENIIETTFLLSLEKGFDSVSIKDIGENLSSCGSSGIYYHFSKKEALLECIIDEYLIRNIDTFKKAIESHEGSLLEKLKFIFYYHVGINILDGSSVLSDDIIDYRYYYYFFIDCFHTRPALRDKLYKFRLMKLNYVTEYLGDFSSEDRLFIQTILRSFIYDWMLSSNFDVDMNIDRYCNMILSNLEK